MSNNNRNSNSNTNGNNNRNSVVILGKRYNINTTTRLDLSYNKLTSLPESIGRLTNLERLDLDNNELTSLPESIGRLTKLEKLDLSYNNFTRLPESIGRLTKLEILSLHTSNLTSLPESIGNLTNLEYLELTDNNLTSLPESFKNLNRHLEIHYSGSIYTRNEFIKIFRPNIPKRISKNTQLFNKEISNTKKISNIPMNKRVYINTNSNVKNNGELRRLYNKNGINRYMNVRYTGRLHGGNFRMSNVKNLKNTNIVNKNVYLRNIKSRLMNSSLNNFNQTVERIKTNLPSNVNKTDVNNMVRSMKPQVLQKIFNKLKNSPSNNRVRIMNTMKNRGFMNNSDIAVMKKKLLSSNFVRNSKKSPPKTIKVNKMNSNNVRKSPYI